MKRLVLSLSAAAGAILLAGCRDDFAPYNRVEGLRVLAVRADPASPAPGDLVTLTTLVAAPAGQAVSYTWSFCPLLGDPATGFACLVDEADLRLDLDATVPDSSADLPAFDLGHESTATFRYSLAPLLLLGICNELGEDAVAGPSLACAQSFPAGIKLTVESGGATITAVKIVPLRYDPEDPENHNPAVEGIDARVGDRSVTLDDRGGQTLLAGYTHPLAARVPPAGAEAVSTPEGGTRRERLLFTWFVDAGETEAERTRFVDGVLSLDAASQNRWTLPDRAGSRANAARLWLVVHDDRGGVGWRAVTIRVDRD